jgi:hypothetical protein
VSQFERHNFLAFHSASLEVQDPITFASEERGLSTRHAYIRRDVIQYRLCTRLPESRQWIVVRHLDKLSCLATDVFATLIIARRTREAKTSKVTAIVFYRPITHAHTSMYDPSACTEQFSNILCALNMFTLTDNEIV